MALFHNHKTTTMTNFKFLLLILTVCALFATSCEVKDLSTACFKEYEGLQYEGTKDCGGAQLSSTLKINGEAPIGLLNVTWDGFSFSMVVDKKAEDCSKMEVSPSFTGGAGGLVITKLLIKGSIVRDGDTCTLHLTR